MTEKHTFIKKLLKAHQDAFDCPPPEMIIRFFDDLLGVLFPEFTEQRLTEEVLLNERIEQLEVEFKTILNRNRECVKGSITGLEKRFFDTIPEIRSQLLLDIEAMYNGDPAAKSKAEVIRTYPGFYAIAAYRIAHAILNLDVVLIPRIISEHAHSKTGIDIHPGARIGSHFCIDHGTGIVIGETTIIGDFVKIYQGVTIGALSVKKEDARKKRHPTIHNNVVIYAGASILGGETEIGEGCTIGGNVWLTQSVPPKAKVYYQAKMTHTDGETDLITFK